MTPKAPQPMEGQMQMVIVHPRSGEAIDLHSAPTDDLLGAHDAFMDLTRELAEGKREVDDEIVRRMDHEGRRSFTFDSFKVTVDPPTEKRWDMDLLASTLDELVEHGLISGAKAEKCVVYEPKLVWREVKTLLSDPRVKGAIEECFDEVDARRYVKVTRR